ncbi:MAG: histidine kinase dimerization/phosphoacceptor domain -containing protein [Methanobacteriaceae archaeon]|nr:histidine kinase dimerization/phosphoacceptor domain -containing protein [Methanobacteriaceae archaeon]
MVKSTIMVVEDESLVALQIKNQLEAWDYYVPKMVFTGEEAVETALKLKPDIILMDIVLRGDMDGIEASKTIRKDLDVPIIYLTAYNDYKTLERAIKTMPSSYIVKPFESRELKFNVESALHKRKMEMEIQNTEKKIEKITQASPIPQFFIDQDHRVVYWNQALEVHTGIKLEDIFGSKNHWKAFYSEKRPCMADFLLNNDLEGLKNSYKDSRPSRLVSGAFEAVDFFPNLGESGKWLYFTAKAIEDDQGNIMGALETLEDITESKIAHQMLQRELSINKALANISTMLVSPGSTIEEVAKVILVEAKALTGSAYGVVSFIEPKTYHKDHRTFNYTLPERGVSEEDTSLCQGDNGLYSWWWGYSLNIKEPFFTNNPSNHPASQGMPAETPEIEGLLSAQVLIEDEVVGQIALANPGRDYTENDMDLIKRLVDFYALAIQNKRAEDQIKNSLREKEVLLQEINHRVKNNMQIISSLLSLQSEYLDAETVAILKGSQNRLRSMAIIHEKLYQSRDFSRINFAEYIEKLVNDLFYSYGVDKERIKPLILVDDVNLGIETAIPCGLIVNELVSNSLKYAFPNGGGELLVELNHIDDDFQLTVADKGVGLPVDLDISENPSLGLKLVELLVIQLNGEFFIDRSEGTAFIIRFKELKYTQRIKNF